jgi:hypothetical protein
MPPARVKAADAWPPNCVSSLEPCESFLSRSPRSRRCWLVASAADVARVNQLAQVNRWFRVDYVEPIATKEDAHVARPAGIASVDAAEIGFYTRAGDVETVPLRLVKGVTVKERASGVAAGAGVGLVAGVLVVGSVTLLASAVHPGGFPDSGDPNPPPCDSCVAKTVAFFIGVPTVVGCIVGYFKGGRRTFDFGHAR